MSRDQLELQRQRILKEMESLSEFRRGTICEQFFESTGRDGSKKRLGPYHVYTYKENGKTKSRRLTGPEQVALCQQQIDAFRRFQELTAELLRVGEQAGNLALEGEALKKTSRSRSKSRKTPK